MPPEGKLRGVRFALHQLLAAELGDGRAGAGRAEEAIVLLGGQPGHRLEQVGVVRGPVFDGPVLHGAGDRVGDGRVERHALLDRLLQCLEHRLGQPCLLHFLAEHERPEQVLDVRGAEVDLVQVVLGVRDRLDRLLAGGGHAWSGSCEVGCRAKRVRVRTRDEPPNGIPASRSAEPRLGWSGRGYSGYKRTRFGKK